MKKNQDYVSCPHYIENTPVYREAVDQAAERCGGQRALGRKAGLGVGTVSKIVNGRVKKVQMTVAKRLRPYLLSETLGAIQSAGGKPEAPERPPEPPRKKVITITTTTTTVIEVENRS